MPTPFLLLTVATYASVWNGKADTKWYKDSETEFTITTPEQLAGLAKLVNKGNDFKGKTIKLGANIMLNDTANWQNWEKKKPKNKWKPIGFEKVTYFHIGHLTLSNRTNNYFSGTFDGGSFIVSGVYVSESDAYKGLFGCVRKGVIKNLGVTASYIKGSSYVGGLVGFIDGQITNCYSKTLVTGVLSVGGLVGHVDDSESRIVNSYSTGTVTGKNYVGGLVGGRGGQIIGSYSTGTVTGEETVGGLVGDLFGNITSSYSTGTVTGRKGVGGLVGNNAANISNSYSSGSVTGDSLVGGLVGTIWFEGKITESYSVGAVAGRTNVGGLVGKIRSNGNVINSYYCKELSGQNDNGKGESKTIAKMKKKETFTDWDFDKTWGIDSKVNGGYPYLRTE